MSYIVQESLVQDAIYSSRIIRTECLYYMQEESVRYRVFMSYIVQESSVQSVIYSRVSFYVLEYLVVNRIVVKRVLFKWFKLRYVHGPNRLVK
jgi:hypothetical protein